MEPNKQQTPSYQPIDPLDTEPTTQPISRTPTPGTYDTDTTTTAGSRSSLVTQTPIAQSPSAGRIVLQWLTYAFWGWTLLALSWLTFVVIFYFLEKNASLDQMLPYALAANLVLLPISLICDIIYHRHEQVKKTGISMAVMIIHAVLFALFGIGALIGTVLSLVQLLVADGSTKTAIATLISFGVVTLLYAATFVRTLNPKNGKLLPRLYFVLISGAILTFIVLAFAGPFTQARATKNDRLIENNLTTVQSAIGKYVTANNRLPASLNDITLSSDAKQLVTSKLVEYKNEGEVTGTDTSNPITIGPSYNYRSTYAGDRLFHYQLCVTYQAASESAYDDIDTTTVYGDYTNYVSTYGHPAGHICYKLQQSTYNSVYEPITNNGTSVSNS